jgi:hypothetical protein
VERIGAWRRRLVGLAVIFAIPGLTLAVAAFRYEVTPYDQTRADVVGPFVNLLIFSGPLLLSIALCALSLRRGLPRVTAGGRSSRSAVVTALSLYLLVAGTCCFVALSVLLIVSYVIVGCSSQGCCRPRTLSRVENPQMCVSATSCQRQGCSAGSATPKVRLPSRCGTFSE